MRKNAKCVLVALLSFCFVVNVNAAECSYEKQVELNNIASTVKATYEEVQIDTGETASYVDDEGIIDESKQVPIVKKGFNVKVLNLTENLYVVVTNNHDSNEQTYYYKDTNEGTIDIGKNTADEIYTYTITVRGIGDECSGYELRTITVVTPIYNPYSEYNFCKDYPDFEYCQEYITDASFSLEDFLAKSAEYREKKQNVATEEEQKEENKILNFIKENKKILTIIGIIILIAGVTTIVIIIIKRRSRLI